MNILIPDSWLRQHIDTKATVSQIREYLSLCGPSVERVIRTGKESVYDIEVTTNRVDMMSVRGIAREAAAILPQFGIPAKLSPLKTADANTGSNKTTGITIKNDERLCQRIIAVKLDNISSRKSPKQIAEFLTLVGERPINAAVDITNYVMYEVGYPIHAFDYDRLTEKHIMVRAARKGEHFVTLDGKKHTTLGGEIVFDDGKGTIIDLPAIMGCENTSVHEDTKSILLWAESADPVKIRQASMGLAIRSQAAVINEKHPDPELAMVAVRRAIYLYKEILGVDVGSRIEDIYPVHEKTADISIDNSRLWLFIGEEISVQKSKDILTSLGFSVSISQKKDGITLTVTPPSWRRQDITTGEDIIEEVARIYGYHRIKAMLPATSAIPRTPEPILVWEKTMKDTLASWGYTELYTYSMISKKQIEQAGFNLKQSYRITNPLVSDHEYMRPSLLPSVLQAFANNLRITEHLKMFELSNVYTFRDGKLPNEESMLLIVQTGNSFRGLKGIAETIFEKMGVRFPLEFKPSENPLFDNNRSLNLGVYGSVGFLKKEYAATFGIYTEQLALELSFGKLVTEEKYHVSYTPVSKYPTIKEDLSFTVPQGFHTGPFLQSLMQTDKRIRSLTLHDIYMDTRTVRVVYGDNTKNLTNEDIKPIRDTLIRKAQTSFNAFLRV